VGGNGQTEQKLLDSATLKELDSFPWQRPTVIPGDEGLLLDYKGTLHLRLPGKLEYPIEFGDDGIWPSTRFLSDKIVAGFSSGSVRIIKIDGGVLYRLPVKNSWSAELVTSASGSRFCIHQIGYTRWNSLMNFADIDQGRPSNFESLRVMDCESGKLLFELKWDPRPYGEVVPALSPNGQKIAIVRGGFLEIFEIP
jgi:hypothetical protein